MSQTSQMLSRAAAPTPTVPTAQPATTGTVDAPDQGHAALPRALPPLAARGRSSPLATVGQSAASALEALLGNKLRAFLTMLGIIIGVGAVIVVIAIGQGAAQQVQQRLAQLGTNVVSVMPGSTRTAGVAGGQGSASTLTTTDVTAISQQVPGITALTPLANVSAQVAAGANNWNTRIQAAYPAFQTIGNYPVAEGSFFTQADEDSGAAVAVLGQTVAQNLFPNGQDPIGQQIRIRNVVFRVEGVLQTKGANGFQDQDDIVLIPFSTAQQRLLGATAVQQIQIQVAQTNEINSVIAGVTQTLDQTHHLAPGAAADFTVRNQQQFVSTAEQSSQTLTVLLTAVAAVSLLVGGIGIMNIMLVSVTERTREIGIRMAIGARGADVLAQFLVEAITLSLVGGLLGVLGGAAATVVVARLASWPTLIAPLSVALAFGFAALIGVAFGYYPARRAARLDPIIALRHE